MLEMTIESLNYVQEFGFGVTETGAITLNRERIEGDHKFWEVFTLRYPTLFNKAQRQRVKYIEESVLRITAMDEMHLRLTSQGDVARIMQGINNFNTFHGCGVSTLRFFHELQEDTEPYEQTYFNVRFQFLKAFNDRTVKIILSLCKPFVLGEDGLDMIKFIAQYLPERHIFLRSPSEGFIQEGILEIVERVFAGAR